MPHKRVLDGVSCSKPKTAPLPGFLATLYELRKGQRQRTRPREHRRLPKTGRGGLSRRTKLAPCSRSQYPLPPRESTAHRRSPGLHHRRLFLFRDFQEKSTKPAQGWEYSSGQIGI